MSIGGGRGEWDYPRVVYRNIGHVILMLNSLPPPHSIIARGVTRRIISFNDARVCTRHRPPRSCGPPNCFLAYTNTYPPPPFNLFHVSRLLLASNRVVM